MELDQATDGRVPRLRPIFYGVSRVGPGAPPKFVASVHSAEEELLGYVAIDRLEPAPAWGPLLAHPGLSVDDACVLARAVSAQFSLYGIGRGSGHFLFTAGGGPGAEARREEYLDALQSLAGRGILEIAFEDNGGGPELEAARSGLVASAVAAVSTILAHVGVPAGGARVSQHLASSLSVEVAAVLERDGMCLPTGNGHSPSDVEVTLVGAPIWTLDDEWARHASSRIVVSLGAARASAGADRMLHERGVVFVPGAVAAGGALAALALVKQGKDPALATAMTAELTSRRVAEALELPDRPFPRAAEEFAATVAGTRDGSSHDAR
ncbi:MAG TPA: hypothetical protein VFG61_04030 [Gaiellaceae bacterium]|nr:hypothetical protein [Gaiellaceae bacterium]